VAVADDGSLTGTQAARLTTTGDTVLAAGAVLWRPGPHAGPEIVLVHRPKYDDWSLPKGKLLPGEHPLAAAVREVQEETGRRAVLGRPLATQHYVALGLPKQVRYWAARADEGEFAPADEVDDLAWLPTTDAATRLTHPRDRELVGEFAAAPADTWALVVLRHAKAFPRRPWHLDDRERPLIERGYEEAARLVPLLAAYGIRRVVTSPARRCRDTVVPYADEAEVRVEEVESLSEEAYRADGRGVHPLVDELLDAAVPTVVCTHRPVLPGLSAAVWAASEGAASSPRSKLSPGSFWVVHLCGRQVVALEEHSPDPQAVIMG